VNVPQLSREKLNDRVPQARHELVLAAQRHQPIVYGVLIRKVGTSRGYIGQILEEVNYRQQKSDPDSPILTALVIHEGYPRRPGPGFWELPQTKGVPENARESFWKDECERVFKYNWRLL
jgi:hypothetical protein